MSRESTRRFFDEDEEPAHVLQDAPLAERMRPRSLEEFVGQAELVGPGSLLRHVLERGGQPGSLILWGPPGSGKTTLARLIAERSQGCFVALSAVSSGVKEVRDALEHARRIRGKAHTILFIDEIHRFNKAQQDALLGAVEDGTITLIGATTENPSFEVNSALLSRSRVLTLGALEPAEVAVIVRRALHDAERGLAGLRPIVSDDLIEKLAKASGGDARVALTALEQAVLATAAGETGERRVESVTLEQSLGRARFSYDRQGEDHYNLVSALIKSTRNSNERAALYWLARLIAGGADPMFIARRLCILASEDVGLADPQAMVQAAAAAQISHLIGFPEALFPLTQATIYLARAPKSATVKTAFHAAAEDAAKTPNAPVPLHLRNAVTPLMKAAGYGLGYRSIHDDPTAEAEMPCLPPELLQHHENAEIPAGHAPRRRAGPHTSHPGS